jgi:hypothetical protein
MAVRQESRKELTRALQERYWRSDKAGRGRILDTFCEATRYHRKYAIELLKHGSVKSGPKRRRRGRPQTYDSRVIGALRVVAEASGWICGKRLAPGLADLVPALEREGALRIDAHVRAALLALSPATIDRRLAGDKRTLKQRGLGTTKPGSLLKSQIPIQTYLPWDEQVPGFVEIDLVAHCGASTAGDYAFTLDVTDIATGWTECTAIPNKSQEATSEGLTRIRDRFPFPLKGIDSDNGSEFINYHLLAYCQNAGLSFTRCRAYHKDDQAHIEEKNWDVVRKTIGYDRFRGNTACEQLDRVYTLLGLYRNCYLPAMKCTGKERFGSKVRKRYDIPASPYRRILAAKVLTVDEKLALAERVNSTGPMTLKRQIERELDILWDRHSLPTNGSLAATA